MGAIEMDLLSPATILAIGLNAETVGVWMEHAFYPALLGILVIASLGLPIPEDVPLIAAGVILHLHPEAASWTGTLLVALLGIMSGDVILYSAGRRWGRDVFRHRSVSWLITPERLEGMTERFHRHGMWMCFIGRFFMGIRAVMCITAGVTRFKFWKFFLADFVGALLSVPLFVVLGFAFANMLPRLREYIVGVNSVILVLFAVLTVGFVWYEIRKHRRRAAAAHARVASSAQVQSAQQHAPALARPAPRAETADAAV